MSRPLSPLSASGSTATTRPAITPTASGRSAWPASPVTARRARMSRSAVPVMILTLNYNFSICRGWRPKQTARWRSCPCRSAAVLRFRCTISSASCCRSRSTAAACGPASSSRTSGSTPSTSASASRRSARPCSTWCAWDTCSGSGARAPSSATTRSSRRSAWSAASPIRCAARAWNPRSR